MNHILQAQDDAEIAALRQQYEDCRMMLMAVVLQYGGKVKIESSILQNMRPGMVMNAWRTLKDDSYNIKVSNPKVPA